MADVQATYQLDDNELVITRIFNAPLKLVYQAWTEAERLLQWWGPAGLKLSVSKFDFSPGGIFLYSMTAPDGNEMWGRFVYGDIIPQEKITFINSFSDAEGNIIRAPFSETWPLEVNNILTFAENEGKTSITLRGGPVNPTAVELNSFKAMRDNMQQGFEGTFSQLDEYLVTVNS